VAEYPFAAFTQRRLRMAAPSGGAIVGLRFEQGQLAGVATTANRSLDHHGRGAAPTAGSPAAGKRDLERVCSRCGVHRARAFADFYRDAAAVAAATAAPPAHPKTLGRGGACAARAWAPLLSAAAATAEASTWYRLVAEAGDASALAELGALLGRQKGKRRG
jgi:hypothetical protein